MRVALQWILVNVPVGLDAENVDNVVFNRAPGECPKRRCLGVSPLSTHSLCAQDQAALTVLDVSRDRCTEGLMLIW